MTNSLIEKTETEIAGLSVPLRGLWYAAKGDWNRAHELVQNDPSAEASWVHAYLHRVEGDLGNAHYWYHQAGKPPVGDLPLEEELRQIIRVLDRTAR